MRLHHDASMRLCRPPCQPFDGSTLHLVLQRAISLSNTFLQYKTWYHGPISSNWTCSITDSSPSPLHPSLIRCYSRWCQSVTSRRARTSPLPSPPPTPRSRAGVPSTLSRFFRYRHVSLSGSGSEMQSGPGQGGQGQGQGQGVRVSGSDSGSG